MNSNNNILQQIRFTLYDQRADRSASTRPNHPWHSQHQFSAAQALTRIKLSRLWILGRAYYLEIDQFADQKSFRWIPIDETPLQYGPGPLTFSYRYKLQSASNLNRKKQLRYHMRPNASLDTVHFEQYIKVTFTAGKNTARLIIAHAAVQRKYLKYLGIKSAYTTDNAPV